MRYNPKWEQLFSPILQDTDYELVGVVKAGGGKHTVFRVYIDKPGGITIDEIAKLTKAIDMALATEIDLGPFTLEVSSPGVDRPLFTPAQFEHQVGQKIKLKLGQLKDNRKKFVGILKATSPEGIMLEEDAQTYEFRYAEIDEAQVVSQISFGKKAVKKEAHDE